MHQFYGVNIWCLKIKKKSTRFVGGRDYFHSLVYGYFNTVENGNLVKNREPGLGWFPSLARKGKTKSANLRIALV